MDQPFFVLAFSFTLCMAGLFSFLWLFPKEAILALSRGVWIIRERTASLGMAMREGRTGELGAGGGEHLSTVALIQEPLWEVWKEREPAAQAGD